MRLLRPSLGVALLLTARALEPQSVPVHQEPRHRLVFDSVRFRVLDVQIPPGDTTLFHTHETPVIYVTLSVSATDAQVVGGAWSGTTARPMRRADPGAVRIDSSYALRAVTHRVTNVGDRLYRLIGITSAARGVGADGQGLGPQLLGTVELRTSWYEQSRRALAPNEETDWRTSTAPVVVVQALAHRVEVERATGARSVLEAATPWAVVLPGVRYRLRNLSGAATHVVAIRVR
jgi:hypothetical protein